MKQTVLILKEFSWVRHHRHVIPDTQETETRNHLSLGVQSQTGQHSGTLPQKKLTKLNLKEFFLTQIM
jgi:hypothetical protein